MKKYQRRDGGSRLASTDMSREMMRKGKMEGQVSPSHQNKKLQSRNWNWFIKGEMYRKEKLLEN